MMRVIINEQKGQSLMKIEKCLLLDSRSKRQKYLQGQAVQKLYLLRLVLQVIDKSYKLFLKSKLFRRCQRYEKKLKLLTRRKSNNQRKRKKKCIASNVSEFIKELVKKQKPFEIKNLNKQSSLKITRNPKTPLKSLKRKNQTTLQLKMKMINMIPKCWGKPLRGSRGEI